MSKRKKKKAKAAQSSSTSFDVGLMPYQALGHRLVEARDKGEHALVDAIEEELERRKTQTPLRVRKRVANDDQPDQLALVAWQAQRFYDHYGIDPDDPEQLDARLIVAIDENVVEESNWEPEVLSESDRNRLTDMFVKRHGRQPEGDNFRKLWLDESDEAKAKRQIEFPLRVMVKRPDRPPEIDYIPRETARDEINELCGGETEWIGTPPDLVVLHRKGARGEGAESITVMCCGDANEAFKDTGIIRGPLGMRDLSDAAETAFRHMIRSTPPGMVPVTQQYGGKISQSVHKRIIRTTSKRNNRNRSNNVKIKFRGRLRPLSEWAECFNLNVGTLRARLQHRWNISDALLTRPNVRPRH